MGRMTAVLSDPTPLSPAALLTDHPEWHELLSRLAFFPGMTREQARRYLPDEALDDMLEANLLAPRHTAAGVTLNAGPAWREALGLNPRYQSPPIILEDAVYLLNVLHDLELEGYTYHGKFSRSLHDVRLGDRQFYLTGAARGVRVRTVRRLLHDHAGHLIRMGAHLIVAHPAPHRLRTPDTKNPSLIVRRTPTPWSTTTRQRGKRSASDVQGTAAATASRVQDSSNPSRCEQSP